MTACRSAVIATRAVSVRSSAHPTAFRENRSMITARNTNSTRRRIYVISATQSWFTPVRVMRAARFRYTSHSCRESEVSTYLR